MQPKPSLGVIGAGKVGQTLARLLFQAGYTIGAVYSRSPVHAETLAGFVASRVTNSPYEVLIAVDLTLLTVPDDAIAALAARLGRGDLSGKAVVHTSGALDSRSLELLGARGALVGSLHPIYPFADVDSAVTGLPGAAFGLESQSEALMECLGDIVRALNGTILRIPVGEKAVYHAALVIASNYTVVLYDTARRLLSGLGADEMAVDYALSSLLSETVANLRMKGVPDALTGPLVRGDTGTIAAHLEALRQRDPLIAAMYRDLARLALPMLEARAVKSDSIVNLLDQDESDATDHS